MEVGVGHSREASKPTSSSECMKAAAKQTLRGFDFGVPRWVGVGPKEASPLPPCAQISLCEISVVIRLLAPPKFVDPMENSIDPQA
jgi:hypothetical protein